MEIIALAFVIVLVLTKFIDAITKLIDSIIKLFESIHKLKNHPDRHQSDSNNDLR